MIRGLVISMLTMKSLKRLILNKKYLLRFTFPIACILYLIPGLFSCNTPYVPKPKGYFKISFPQHKYQRFNPVNYPYTFEYPVYAQIVKDTSFFDDKPENPYWINIDFPQFHARMYVSYKQVSGNFDKLREDAYKM